jgi:hypothetical protein
MACDALLIWPEVENDHQELLLCMTQPDFPDNNWPVWRFRVDGDESLLRGGCGALLAYSADGLPKEDVQWVSPAELLAAVDALKRLIEQKDQSIADALWDYEDFGRRGVSETDALLQDLEVIRAKAHWAQALGKTRLTFNLVA